MILTTDECLASINDRPRVTCTRTPHTRQVIFFEKRKIKIKRNKKHKTQNIKANTQKPDEPIQHLQFSNATSMYHKFRCVKTKIHPAKWNDACIERQSKILAENSLQIFQNQKEFGENMCRAFLDLSIFAVMAVAPTQSGKTGSMISACLQMCKHPQIQQDPEKVFVLTGHSSKDWVLQTKKRFPDVVGVNVYHRNTLDKFVQHVVNLGEHKRNILIFIDEVQYASMPRQCLYRVFQKCGFLNLSEIYTKNIKLVFVSATPDGIMVDMGKWSHGCKTIFMTPGESYVSVEKLQSQGQLCHYGELWDRFDSMTEDNIRDVFETIDAEYGENHRYHIIRTARGIKHKMTIENFEECSKIRQRNVEYKFVSESNSKIHMLKMLEKKPRIHTFIFIKDKLRCAQTIHKEYIGIMYERYTETPNDSTIIQGLVGRMTGYHDNFDAIIYTNLRTVDKYIKMQESWMNGYGNDRTPILWKSNSTTTKPPYTKHTFLSTHGNDAS